MSPPLPTFFMNETLPGEEWVVGKECKLCRKHSARIYMPLSLANLGIRIMGLSVPFAALCRLVRLEQRLVVWSDWNRDLWSGKTGPEACGLVRLDQRLVVWSDWNRGLSSGQTETEAVWSD